MSPDCIDVERLADVETTPVLKQHVAECPRCQSLWMSYQSFMKADVSGAVNIDAARRELDATIQRKASEARVARDVAPRASSMRVGAAWPGWLRPVIVTAVAAVLTVVAVTVWRSGADHPVLRGDSAATWSLRPPHVSQVAIEFTWNAVPGADAYDVEIFDDALNTVLQSATVTTPSITVDRAALSNVPSSSELAWRVRALHSGDVIATSPPASLLLK